MLYFITCQAFKTGNEFNEHKYKQTSNQKKWFLKNVYCCQLENICGKNGGMTKPKLFLAHTNKLWSLHLVKCRHFSCKIMHIKKTALNFPGEKETRNKQLVKLRAKEVPPFLMDAKTAITWRDDIFVDIIYCTIGSIHILNSNSNPNSNPTRTKKYRWR